MGAGHPLRGSSEEERKRRSGEVSKEKEHDPLFLTSSLPLNLSSSLADPRSGSC
ncbi:hypothetical protein PSMK_20500 [Phycisphaera mikurensis NBRC 102666]|uniref:Uncharacterized protein n=1 Tax=Phycisphaera mikurensis (strain NBRC 102666 / KCTC 22515 / FYK2301M01) TaxID=1142394 RepID=I0IG21_PHYMF|nr:hypothetical protein PSMK_20500 [Phycisphaera mikurensis NBRC 102666]